MVIPYTYIKDLALNRKTPYDPSSWVFSHIQPTSIFLIYFLSCAWDQVLPPPRPIGVSFPRPKLAKLGA
jgi:hypothetical protein